MVSSFCAVKIAAIAASKQASKDAILTESSSSLSYLFAFEDVMTLCIYISNVIPTCLCGYPTLDWGAFSFIFRVASSIY